VAGLGDDVVVIREQTPGWDLGTDQPTGDYLDHYNELAAIAAERVAAGDGSWE
jgi:hypothetical protein